MKKTDIIIGPIIGFFIGIFFFIFLRTLQVNIPHSWFLLIVFPPLTLLGLFVASIIGKKVLALYQMAKFVLVGALNTMVDLGVLNFLMWIFGIYTGIFYVIFKGISFLVATTNSYFWNKYWTFEKRRGAPAIKEFSKFLLAAAIFLLVSTPSFLLLPPLFILKFYYIGPLIVVGIAYLIWNFISPQFGIFLLITGTGLFINVGVASFVVNTIGPQFGIADELWANVGAFVAILFAWVWNFTGAKFIVFKK